MLYSLDNPCKICSGWQHGTLVTFDDIDIVPVVKTHIFHNIMIKACDSLTLRSTGFDTKGKNTTLLHILLAASMSVGLTWERAHLLVDSGSEHPPLISQSFADRMGLRGPLAGGATQANGDYWPLYDVGQLHLEW